MSSQPDRYGTNPALPQYPQQQPYPQQVGYQQTGPQPVPYPHPQAPQGFPVPGQPVMVAQYGPAPQNGAGTGGFVTGLLGLIFVWVPIAGIVLSILGVALSGVGIAKAKRGEANNKGLAIAGLTCGTIALALWVILLVAAASVL